MNILARVSECMLPDSFSKTYHGHRVQLPERLHSLEHNHNEATTFDGFYCPGEEVGRYCFEVLQYAHSERLAENLLRFFVVPTRADNLDGVNKYEPFRNGGRNSVPLATVDCTTDIIREWDLLEHIRFGSH